MNYLRSFLQAQGLSARDIEEAVDEARKATRVIHVASGASVEVFTKLANRVKNEKAKTLLAKGATALQKVHAGTGDMLRKKS